MVLSASAAAEGQAGQTAWLARIQGILELGRDGVLILVPDAKLAALRPLMRALWAVDERARIVIAAEQLTQCSDHELIVLALRLQDATWLNRNRPLFAQRHLRVVLWADEAVVGEMRGRAPDFFDWISHVVECPFAVPEFTRRGLELGARWHPGIVWRGGLDLRAVLEQLGVDYVDGPGEVEYPAWVAFLAGCEADFVRVAEVSEHRSLRRIRWATAETRFAGKILLDSPELDTPGWFPVDARQRPLAEFDRDRVELGVLLEAESEALRLAEEIGLDRAPARTSTMGELDQWMLEAAQRASDWPSLRRAAITMRRGGPVLRALFAGDGFDGRPHALVKATSQLGLPVARAQVVPPEALREYLLGCGEELGWSSPTVARVLSVAFARAPERHTLAEAVFLSAQDQLGRQSLDLAKLSRLLAALVGSQDGVAAARPWLERACDIAGLECDLLAALDLLEGRIERGVVRLEPLMRADRRPSLRERQVLILALRMHGQSDRASEFIGRWSDDEDASAADFEFGPPREWLDDMLQRGLAAELPRQPEP
jgi:hypothetical protein